MNIKLICFIFCLVFATLVFANLTVASLSINSIKVNLCASVVLTFFLKHLDDKERKEWNEHLVDKCQRYTVAPAA